MLSVMRNSLLEAVTTTRRERARLMAALNKATAVSPSLRMCMCCCCCAYGGAVAVTELAAARSGATCFAAAPPAAAACCSAAAASTLFGVG
jgi:hypothetical protein